MQREIEQKYRLANPQALRARLRELAAQPRRRQFERNTILDTPTRTLLTAGCGLRLREATDLETGEKIVTLCYKGRAGPGTVKNRPEIELPLVTSSGAAMESLFEQLGYAAVVRFEKRRESWELPTLIGDVGRPLHVTIDEMPAAGFFSEIEGESESQVLAAAAQLRFRDVDIEPNTYVAIAVRLGQRPSEPGPLELCFET